MGKRGDSGLWKSILIACPKYFSLKKRKKGRRIEK
jgi:hypothetical protein